MSRPQDITRRQSLGRLSALLGGLVSAPTVAGVLSGCEPIEESGWTPQVLTPEQNRMVTTIADIVADEMGLDPDFEFTGGERGWVGDVPRMRLSVEKLAALGWEPDDSSDDAVRRATRELLDQ